MSETRHKRAMRLSDKDPFKGEDLRGPGLLRALRESFLGSRRLLDVMQIEVTSFCPGKCVYCPHTTMQEQWKARHMSGECYAALWPLLLETRRAHLQGWGEPLLHPRFFDMVALARKADCLVSTTTCGLRMDEDLAVSLVKSGLDIVAFSLTGASAQSNNAARTGVDFDRTLDSIRILQKTRRDKLGVHLELHFAYLMLAGQEEDVLMLPDLMQELGMHAAVVSTLDYLPSPEWARAAFLPHEAEKIARARDLLEEAAAKATAQGAALYYSLPGPAPLPTCLENPSRSVYVDAEGNLSPCIYVNLPTKTADANRRVFGNCLAGNALETWGNEAFTNFREALAGKTPDAPCLECPKRFAVGNRLPGGN